MSGTGGAVFAAGTLDIISTSFIANKAETEGMAIFIARVFSSSGVEFTNVSFAKNAFRCPPGEYGYDETDAVSTCQYIRPQKAYVADVSVRFDV